MRIWKPEVFQGRTDKKGYFEGWYFKLVDENEKCVLSIIPGISVEDGGKSHSFIQVIDGKEGISHYFEYPIEEFKYKTSDFYIKIGNNIFTKAGIILDIEEDGFLLKADLVFDHLFKWPVMLTSPGIMGPYRFLPFMQCYHGVVSMNHNINGKLRLNHQEIEFKNGKGYIEKDWGISFPKSWIWAQSNHFEKEDVSISISVAHIPFLKTEFNGFLIGLLYNNNLYRFTTYTGAKLERIDYKEDYLNIRVSDKKYTLDISVIPGNTSSLIAPENGKMTTVLSESLSSSIEVSLNDKKGRLIFQGTGINAGLEISGRLE